MIDLHSHILPGLDDGAPDIEASLAIARAASADGIQTMLATPHVNFEYPTQAERMRRAVGELNVALARAEIALAVLPGAEIAVTKLDSLAEEELRGLTLAAGDTLLIESPYTTSVPFLEQQLDALMKRGYQIVLAHPERSPLFRSDVDRLGRLVDDGIFTAVNVGSLAGRFGERSHELSIELMERSLVHVLASDCHDTHRRPPGLKSAMATVEEQLPGITEQLSWYGADAPGAILAGRELPGRPEPLSRKTSKRRLPLLGRRRRGG